MDIQKTKSGIVLQADSIVAQESHSGTMHTFILFNPTEDTRKVLSDLTQYQRVGKIKLCDKWNDGTYDTHVSLSSFTFVSWHVGAARKQHTVFALFLST